MSHALQEIFAAYPSLTTRGFLPEKDPLTHFPKGSPLEILDAIGKEVPAKLTYPQFRDWAEHLEIPPVPASFLKPSMRPSLRLYYVRLAFFASAYVHQTMMRKPATMLPKNIAAPFKLACDMLSRPSILSYDGYALYNWRRIDPRKPVELGNIATIQNFVDFVDGHNVNQESWFILNHVDQEAKAARILNMLAQYAGGTVSDYRLLTCIEYTVREMREVLLRIPEHMDSNLYFDIFRPYINGFFHGVVYEGVSDEPMVFRGETGAQSSIMPLLESLLKIPHKPSILTKHLTDMCAYMPHEHRELIAAVDALPSISDTVSKIAWNGALDAIAEFRKVHLRWASEYIARHGGNKGTGGTPYMKWLAQLIEETLAAQKK